MSAMPDDAEQRQQHQALLAYAKDVLDDHNHAFEWHELKTGRYLTVLTILLAANVVRISLTSSPFNPRRYSLGRCW